MVNNKTAVVALIQAVLDGAPSLNTAGIHIIEQLGILMSDRVEVLYSSHKRRDDKQCYSGYSHTGNLGWCTEPEHSWRIHKQTTSLGILMSDQVEVLCSSRKRRDDKQGCSGCSHTSHLELCTEPEQGWHLHNNQHLC